MTAATKTCASCKSEKPTSEFYLKNKKYFQSECKVCTKSRRDLWWKTDAGKLSSANSKLKARFGITLDEFNRMYTAQEGRCLICRATESQLGHRLAVDHCHNTNQIRGLLCKACNVGIGNLRDSAILCARAAEYLNSFQ